MTNMSTHLRFILNYAQNLWGEGKFGAPER